MASASGVSVVGTQILISAVPVIERTMNIGLGGDFAVPPTRVGFYYVVSYRLTTGLEARMVGRGPVYEPGIIFALPNLGLNTGFRYRVWVEWNNPGFNWSIVTS